MLNLLLGFILGFGLIQQFALSNATPDVKAKAEEARQKLVGFQGTLGIVGILVGIWVIIYNLILYRILNI